MTNSMNSVKARWAAQMRAMFPDARLKKDRGTEMTYEILPRDLHQILAYLKNSGWRQLSMITGVDWIEEGQFELVYNLFDWEQGLRVLLSIRIGRDKPQVLTITNIYAGAQYYEREIHEFFGIEFIGNEDALKSLFLERWDALPPLRKDFDSRAYSDKKYVKRFYDPVYGPQGGAPFERS